MLSSSPVQPVKIAGQIEKRAIAGAVAGVASFGVTLLQGIAAVPILLGFWSVEQYGLWLALQALVVLFQTIDLGHQNYIGNEFNKDLPRGIACLRDRLASGVRAAFLLGSLQVVLAFVLVEGGKLPQVLGVDAELVRSSDAGITFLSLVACWAVFGSVSGVLVRVYAPFGYFAQAQWLGVLQRLVQFLLLVLVAAAGGFLFGYSIAFWIFAVVFALVWFPMLRRRLPEIYPWWKGGSWRMAGQNVGRSTVLTANGIVQQLGMNGLPLLVASQFSAAAVPAFTTLRTVSNTFSQASLVLINPLIPDLIRLHVTGEWNKLNGLFRACWFVGGIVINLGLVVVTPLIPWLYGVWTHGKLPFDAWLFALLALSVAIRSTAAPLAAYVTGMNHLGAVSIANATQTGATLLLSLCFAKSWGLVAFGFGVVTGELAALLVNFLFASRSGTRFTPGFHLIFWLEAGAPLLLVALALAAGCINLTLSVITSTICLLLLAGYYCWVWRQLPTDLKVRFLRLVPQRLRAKWQPEKMSP